MQKKNAKNCILWTALVTPLLENGHIDQPGFDALLRRQEEVGNGVVLFGSTGEGVALSDEEKQTSLNHISSLKLSMPLMIGVGGINLENTKKWLAFCETQPIDAYLLITPPYSKPGVKGQTDWFRSLMDVVKRPCMLYNNPSRSACSLAVGAVKELADHPNFWAIKESSGSLNDFYAYREAAPKVAIYSGEDNLMPYLASAGSAGLVSIVSNAWPKAAHAYVKASLSGKHTGLMPLWHQASSAMFLTSNPIPIKALLHEKGLIKTPYLRAPLSHLDLPNRDILRHFDDEIRKWEKNNFG